MKKIVLSLLLITITLSGIYAQKSEIFTTNGNAIRGFDVVAFFADSKAVKGNDSLAYQWKDANWLFATNENLQAFKSNPEKYAPQYGGYCAYGTADNHKAPTQTDTWTIVDSKLYFNYNNKVKEYWTKNQEALIKKADIIWPNIKNKE